MSIVTKCYQVVAGALQICKLSWLSFYDITPSAQEAYNRTRSLGDSHLDKPVGLFTTLKVYGVVCWREGQVLSEDFRLTKGGERWHGRVLCWKKSLGIGGP